MPRVNCKICGNPESAPTVIGHKDPSLDRLCHTCWKWAGMHLWGWRTA